ncbi:MAG: flagellar hook-length control protein FliK [Betaproteobacteria bacterium HGW-Betaproteobacteria-12]|nr:MAG: flagellar hook-length control protein FliK [Betaproteobacteria bacterium HGW-Betaproteobacteria-12]
MIPADLASRLRVALPPAQQETPQPVAPLQKLTDVLSNLVPGQRILAEVQAMLPNGTYRALVAQRDVTLALPFAAKAGDSLELEVLDSDGKLTLAFVANRTTGQQAGRGGESVPTTLSQTGRLIGNLMGNVEEGGQRAAPAPLNGNQPLIKSFPDAAQLAPILKDALTKSGVFYEAHQARWVAGQLPTDALRQEPQGKTPPSVLPQQQFATASAEAKATDPAPQLAAARTELPAQTTTQQGHPIPRELTPIVQQQLDALATQNYAWQGQVWAGQKMWWEISEDGEQANNNDGEAGRRWQTRLKLSLPALGGIEATLRLQPGGQVEIQMTAESPASETRLRDNAELLRDRFSAAGLDLTQLLVQHGETGS